MSYIKQIIENRATFGRYTPDECHFPLYEKPLLGYDEHRNDPDYKEKVKQKLTELLGDMPSSFEPKVREEYRRDMGTHEEIRLVIETEKNCFCPCLLLLPKGIEKPPVVLCLQGHSQGMLLSVGRVYRLKDIHKIEQDRDFGLCALKFGYASLVIEQRCFGERRSGFIAGGRCDFTAHSALIVGRTLVGERVWDIQKCIDVLEKRGDVDATKLGCMGNSGGGTATFYASCMDERIKIAMPGCSVCTYRDSIGNRNHCACNYIPNIAKYFDMGDLACLIAPRKLIIVAGNEDKIFPLFGVKKVYETIQKIYKDAGKENDCSLVVGNGPHRFYFEGWEEFAKRGKEAGW